MRSMIIHMSASEARGPNARKLLNDLPDAMLVEAVNGRDPAQIEHVQTHPGTLFRPRYPFALTPAEIGVFQSHRKCWDMLVSGDDDFALIVEDDLAVDPAKFGRALALIRDCATPDMYIRLPVKDRETASQPLAQSEEMQLILPQVIGLQCICQVVGRNAAQRLLDITTEIDRPVDTLLQMHWVTGQPVHAVLPNGNREVAAQIGGSTIQTKTRASGKLAREAKRFWYRRQLARHPQITG